MGIGRDSDALRWLGDASRGGAPGGMSDGQLLGRFSADPGPAGALAFEVLVRRHGPAVLARCRGIVRDEHRADDAFQATFLVLARRASTVHDPDRLAAWLDRVARRVALRARAEASRRHAIEEGRLDFDPAEAPVAAAPGLANEEAATLVRAAVGRLPEADRRLIQLTYWQGRTYREAAEALRWPIGTVRSRLARARQRLRVALARVGRSPGAIFGGAARRIAAAPPSAALVERTVRSVAGWTGSKVAPAGIGAVRTLVEGELTMKLLTGKSIAALLVVGGAMTAGTVALARRGADAPPAAPAPSTQEPPAPAAPADPAVAARRDDWARRLAALNEADWRAAFALGQELAAVPADEGIAILRANWGKVGEVQARQQLLKAWHLAMPYPLRFRNHPHCLAALDLGMRDPAPEVRQSAGAFLGDIALRDFTDDHAAYDAWYQANRDRSAAEALTQATHQFVAEAIGLDAAAALDRAKRLATHTSAFRDLPELRRAVADSGLGDVLGAWAAGGRAGARPEEVQLATAALRALDRLGPGEADLRRWVVPLLARDRPAWVRVAALETLDGPENRWAVDLLLDGLQASLGEGDASFRGTVWAAAGALGSVGDPRAIPTMIAVIEAENTYDTVYGVGYFGLGRLTGVEYDESHDGAWWRRWWGENRGKYPEPVQSQAIPQLPPRVRPAPPAPNADVAAVPSQDLRAGGDERKRYFLIGAKEGEPPADGRRLLIVLPGGDGSADFEPFGRRIYKHVLDDRWLIAQAVAPRWREDPDRIVWPTAGLPDPAAKFTTEDFVRAIMADVRGRARVDPRRVYLLGWSSGGPPCYATALGPDSGVAGAFVAMSVFPPEALPPIAGARDRAFYLLQSPDDQVTPIRFAEAAERSLRAAGARVKLDRYEGGHGWRGDVWGMLRAGITWMVPPTRPE